MLKAPTITTDKANLPADTASLWRGWEASTLCRDNGGTMATDEEVNETRSIMLRVRMLPSLKAKLERLAAAEHRTMSNSWNS